MLRSPPSPFGRGMKPANFRLAVLFGVPGKVRAATKMRTPIRAMPRTASAPTMTRLTIFGMGFPLGRMTHSARPTVGVVQSRVWNDVPQHRRRDFAELLVATGQGPISARNLMSAHGAPRPWGRDRL